ncbi:MAG: prevent-host-death family protein [Gammaproteobacteria bacterium RIFCSPHIGHO2_12_FULL_41_15]|nr:MAG: prevent-host-death family protein [Gammaproteobacteria bacterium RIFCSPHIGHO2_12_FULL_41_15]
MDVFTVRDLRERTGTLIHDAEKGKLSLVTKRGRPVFLAVPFSKNLIELGLHASLAITLYKERHLTLEKAAKLASKSLEDFIEILGKLNISVVNYSVKELSRELKDFE